MEIYKNIQGYEGLYQVSNFGNFKSLSKNVILYHGGKRCTQKTLDGVLVKVFGSINQANKETGINIFSISDCMLKRRKNAGGFMWV